MSHDIETTITLNGKPVTRRIAPRTHLIDFLRDEMGLTGSHVGCEHGVCGACTIRLDGKIVRGCLTLAVQANGRDVTFPNGCKLFVGGSSTGAPKDGADAGARTDCTASSAPA